MELHGMDYEHLLLSFDDLLELLSLLDIGELIFKVLEVKWFSPTKEMSVSVLRLLDQNWM